MRIVLDFSAARRNALDDIVGVVARVGDRMRRISISANDVMTHDARADGVTVGYPDICAHQARLAAVLVTGNTAVAPAGDAIWDEANRTMSWPLRSGERRTMD